MILTIIIQAIWIFNVCRSLVRKRKYVFTCIDAFWAICSIFSSFSFSFKAYSFRLRYPVDKFRMWNCSTINFYSSLLLLFSHFLILNSSCESCSRYLNIDWRFLSPKIRRNFRKECYHRHQMPKLADYRVNEFDWGIQNAWARREYASKRGQRPRPIKRLKSWHHERNQSNRKQQHEYPSHHRLISFRRRMVSKMSNTKRTDLDMD